MIDWKGILVFGAILFVIALIFLAVCVLLQRLFFPEKCRQHRAERKRARALKRARKRD